MKSPRHWFHDCREHDPDRPDWQALVDAVDHAAEIATGYHREHVIQTSVHAQIIADSYAHSAIVGAVDGELFALDAALATDGRDLFGKQEAVRRYDYIWRRAAPVEDDHPPRFCLDCGASIQPDSPDRHDGPHPVEDAHPEETT